MKKSKLSLVNAQQMLPRRNAQTPVSKQKGDRQDRERKQDRLTFGQKTVKSYHAVCLIGKQEKHFRKWPWQATSCCQGKKTATAMQSFRVKLDLSESSPSHPNRNGIHVFNFNFCVVCLHTLTIKIHKNNFEQ